MTVKMAASEKAPNIAEVSTLIPAAAALEVEVLDEELPLVPLDPPDCTLVEPESQVIFPLTIWVLKLVNGEQSKLPEETR